MECNKIKIILNNVYFEKFYITEKHALFFITLMDLNTVGYEVYIYIYR